MVLVITTVLVKGADIVERKVTGISPNVGSTLGSTRITITGTGFSTDYAEGENLVEIDGNVCETIEKQGGGVCMGTCSNSERIICDTPPHAGYVAGQTLLFNVVTDMEERHNVAAENPGIQKETTPRIKICYAKCWQGHNR